MVHEVNPDEVQSRMHLKEIYYLIGVVVMVFNKIEGISSLQGKVNINFLHQREVLLLRDFFSHQLSLLKFHYGK